MLSLLSQLLTVETALSAICLLPRLSKPFNKRKGDQC